MGIKQSRGLGFEVLIRERLQQKGYEARRMGGTTASFPDIVATHNDNNVLLCIEAKNSSYEAIYLEVNDVLKCFGIIKMFDLYKWKYAVLACKFMSKFKNTGFTRKIKEYYYDLTSYQNTIAIYDTVKVDYFGTVTLMKQDDKQSIKPATIIFNKNSLTLPHQWLT